MDEPKKPEDKSEPLDAGKVQPIASPGTDPTSPHNQGDWTANERASERRNNEPGLTDEERKQRRW